MKQDKTILLVEDDLVDAKIIQRLFKKLQVTNELTICDNGEIALQWLEDNKHNLPGLILLDLNMPRMNGLEFLKVIKNDELFKLIPTVVLTTSADPSDKKTSYEQQVAGYMLKSVNHDDFVKTIERIKSYWENCELAY